MTACSTVVTGAAALVNQHCRHCSVQQPCPVNRIQGDRVPELQLKEHSFRAGDVLENQGSTSTALRIIKSGATLLRRESRYGNRQSIGVFGRGTVIGSFGLLGRPNPVTQIGILDGRYCELPPQH